MPPVRETVENKPLAGQELQKIILADLKEKMDRDCVLNGVSAFSRVSYEVRYILHFDNQSFPKAEGTMQSRSATADEIEADLGRSNVVPELSDGIPVTDDNVASQTMTRDIESPNQARVEFGLPVPVVTRGADGKHEEREVKYTPSAAQPTKSSVRDSRNEAKAEIESRRAKKRR